jgi:ABC-2 type transport system permease protein
MWSSRILAGVRKEFRQFFRDPVLLILVLWLYTLEVVICATTLSFDLNDEAIAVVDLDRSPSSRSLSDVLDRSPSFAVRFHPASEHEAAELLSRGSVRLVALFPRGYERNLARSGSADVQLVVDGTNSMMAQTALGLAQRMIAAESHRLAHAAGAAATAGPWIENRVRVWYNPDLRFVYSVVISMIATAAYMVGLILPAAGIVREKERGTLEQLLVSPLRPAELIAAKAIPSVIVGLLALGPSMLIAQAFGVPFRGNPFTLALFALAFIVSAIATGVLVASLVHTLQQALFVAFFVLFPVIFLSGTITPIESMPPGLQAVSLLSPLRHFMEAMLGLFLKGVGIDILWPQLLSILGIAAGLFALAGWVFRRRIT